VIDRYTRPEMRLLWSEQRQFETWLKIEIAVCQAWCDLGVIPDEDMALLRANASFDLRRIRAMERVTRHDVVAFTRAVSESLGPERKWIHYGLTSADVVDTAWSVRLMEASELISKALESLLNALSRRAREHKYTLMMGRTHGVHAEPVTFGLKLAQFFAEMKRHQARFSDSMEEMRIGKLSGAVGTFAHSPPEVEQITCDLLGLKPEPVATQVVARDRHAHYVCILAQIGATLEKMAVEVRHLQRSEVREVEEAFRKGQKGSSAMPHKRNPIGSENITGCARLLRGYALAALENVALWHERDISHSSVERVILPDATTIVHYALHRFTSIIRNLVVNAGRMSRNLDRTFGLFNSQRVLLGLIDKGLTREEAYDLVQPLAMESWRNERPLKALLKASDAVRSHLTADEIDAAMDQERYLQYVDALFRRAGLA